MPNKDKTPSDVLQAQVKDFQLLTFDRKKSILMDYIDDTPGGDRLDSLTVERVFGPIFSKIRRLYCLDQYQQCPDGRSEPDAAPLIHDAITDLRESLTALDADHFGGRLCLGPAS